MLKAVAVVTMILASGFAVAVIAEQRDQGNSSSLKMAIEEFNRKAKENPIGQSQPPLTLEEVVAAIRGWIPETTPGVTDDIYSQYQEIAESNRIPEGADFSFCTGWEGYRGYQFKVWWIDLSVKTGKASGYSFRIRDHKISSRKLTATELEEMKNDTENRLKDNR